MKDVILVIDTGSSGMIGILFDCNGEVCFTHQIKYSMTVGTDDSAVMEISVFSRCIKEIASRAAAEIQRKDYNLLAVSLDSQRSSVLAVDEQIRPLHPILMWYDKRCADICSSFSDEELRTIYERCGMRLTQVSSAPKMLWMKRNLPDIYEAAYKLIGIHDYLLYTLTGKLVTDATCACRSALMDIRTFEWSDELLTIFEVEKDKLCSIVRSGSIVGKITDAFSQETGLPVVPVVTAGGDQQCCLLGQGYLEEGTVSINSGSATYLAIPVTTPTLDPKAEVNLSAYHGDTPWVLEGANMGSGTLYQWFNRNFYNDGTECKDTEHINREVAAQNAGCDGLICYADFAGRGCPDTNPHARGVFANVGLQHTRGSFARAILEGICFDIQRCIEHIEGLGIPIHRIQSSGGLTNFPVYNQIMADITNREIWVSANAEATAAGAFLIACTALDIPHPVHTQSNDCRLYQPNADNVRIYQEVMKMRTEWSR
ncbi:MAG: hypothetical protein IKV41_00930 [Oscillospiraceae bacterium]|nr:hypothetical protein [Oscillospiraceae bacterium]